MDAKRNIKKQKKQYNLDAGFQFSLPSIKNLYEFHIFTNF